MRPKKLIMTAFGPYKNTQIIDFDLLGDIQLFVITGATGAGKTTIFDAICFALYGNASGSDRENTTMLRSQFANQDIHTCVEFTFEIKERTYRVLRQIGHIKGGNKSRTGEKYELYEQVDDKEIPAVDRQIVTEINGKIEQLIGLTEDQFKQIVMLPQGEFRKLLTSETENKEAILRRLFSTGKYNFMNHLLKEKKDEVTGKYHQQKLQLDQIIHSIKGVMRPFEGNHVFSTLAQDYYEPGQVLQALKVDLDHLQRIITEDKKNYEKAIYLYEKEQTRYHEGLALNKKFEEMAQKKRELHQLSKEKETIEKKEIQLNQANKATQLEVYETHFKTANQDFENKKTGAENLQEELSKAEKSLTEAEQAYDKEKREENNRDKLKLDIQNYKQFLPLVQKSTQMKTELKNLEENLQKKANHIDAIKEKKESELKTIRKVKELIKQQESSTKKHELTYSLDQIKRQYSLLKEYQECLNKKQSLEKTVNTEKRLYKQAWDRYQHLESDWLNAQAVLLADGLVSDEACPVCGSSHHPNPAVARGGEVTKEILEKQRDKTEEIKSKYEEITSEYKLLLARLKEKAADIKTEQLDMNGDSLETVIRKKIEQGKEVRQAYNQAQSVQEELVRNKKYLEKLEANQDKLVKNMEKEEQTYYKEHMDYTSKQAHFIADMKEIPEKLQEMDTLQETIKQKEAHLEQSVKRWEKVQHHLDLAKKNKQNVSTTLMNIEKQLSELSEKASNAWEAFKQQLEKGGFFSQATYEEAKLSEANRENLKKQIEAHHKSYHLLTEQMEQLQEVLSEKEMVDLTEISKNLEVLKAKYETALNKWNQSQQEQKAVCKLIEEMEKLSKEVKEKENKAAVITDVYDVMRGQNVSKISFERYLQIDYLDNIIEAANERFRELMNGQFYLIRSDRKESRGKQSGLAIDVFDSYTGQTRDVKTLSGGEKFIASLCLALGMSDVIQSFQGSISINTMFIDEGFGSLDEESLHRSINALIQLQEDGRLIGVISHVDELKAIFPAMLEVTKTKDGHSKTAFKIK